MTDRLAIWTDLRMNGVLNVERDVPYLRSTFIDEQNFFGPLDEIERVHAAHDEKSWHTARPAARARFERFLAGSSPDIGLLHLFGRPGFQDGIGDVGDPNRHL